MELIYLHQEEALKALDLLSGGKNCRLQTYNKITVPEFNISGKMIAYASPDSTYHVTEKLFASARKSILIGIYDFSAEHMMACVSEAIKRGVKVSLMLDIDREEPALFARLKDMGVECVEAPACSNDKIRYFASSHEKVIVIDDKWTMIQSGNYSDRSIPFNTGDGIPGAKFKAGNRDMGVAIESEALAKFFTNILRSDMALKEPEEQDKLMEVDFPPLATLAALALYEGFLVRAPKQPPVIFTSQEFNHIAPIKVQPVLSPDNYMDVIPNLIRTAKKSIKIEQQYIRTGQQNITILLDAIKEARENAPEEFSVQIILAPNNDKVDQESRDLLDMGFEVKLLPSKYFTHCHNKLLIIDDQAVLISSQNWSFSAVTKNREAGVILYDENMTDYYNDIFKADWVVSVTPDDGLREISESKMTLLGEQEKFVVLRTADIQDV